MTLYLTDQLQTEAANTAVASAASFDDAEGRHGYVIVGVQNAGADSKPMTQQLARLARRRLMG